MKLADFIKKYTQVPVDFDGAFGVQCMDLMHQWVYEGLGLTDKTLLSAAAAYQVYQNFKPAWGEDFEKIMAGSNLSPSAGDLIVWGTGIGPYGHIAIFVEKTADGFKSFDANWPVGSLPHIQGHDWHGVLGWLHPKHVDTDGVPPPLTEYQQKLNRQAANERLIQLLQANEPRLEIHDQRELEEIRLQYFKIVHGEGDRYDLQKAQEARG